MKKTRLLLVGCLTLVALLAICSTAHLLQLTTNSSMADSSRPDALLSRSTIAATLAAPRLKTTSSPTSSKRECCEITTSKSVRPGPR